MAVAGAVTQPAPPVLELPLAQEDVVVDAVAVEGDAVPEVQLPRRRLKPSMFLRRWGSPTSS